MIYIFLFSDGRRLGGEREKGYWGRGEDLLVRRSVGLSQD